MSESDKYEEMGKSCANVLLGAMIFSLLVGIWLILLLEEAVEVWEIIRSRKRSE